jgi:hypothetical protein
VGRYFVELDPEGFSWAAEPGAAFEWSAVTYIEAQRKRASRVPTTPPENFLTIPGIPWVMCKPKQLNPLWYQAAGMVDHVLRDAGGLWTWAEELLTSIKTFDPAKKPGQTGYPDNEWITIPTVPEDTTSLFNPNWTAISNAAGFALPADMKVLGQASAPPAGGSYVNTTPFIQVRTPPGPDDTVAFGFGEYCLIFSGSGVTLIQVSDSPIPQQYRRVGSWGYSAPTRQISFAGTQSFEQTLRSVLIVISPSGHLGLIFGGGNDAQVVEAYRVDPDSGPAFIVNEHSWWIAAAEGAGPITFQAQVVGYEEADGVSFQEGPVAFDFDLGPIYKPAIEPAISAWTAIHTLSPGDLETVVTTTTFTQENTTNSERIYLELENEIGGTWVSDGTHHAGRWYLKLTPSANSYHSPWIRDWMVKFPVYLIPRLAFPLMLTDGDFSSFDVSTSLYEADGKRLNVDLFDSGLALLADAGFDTREGYPVLIWEDTDDDETPDTIRAAGWVHRPEITELKAETDDANAIKQYRLSAKGLLSRADCGWLILPQMVDPLGGGYVEHTYAVGQAMLAAGIDVVDPAQFVVATDTMAGTARSRLRGTWANKPYTLQLDSKNIYTPKYDESKLAYAERIAGQWAGWRIYETLGPRVRYHPDLMFELSLGGIFYYYSAELYSNSADALAAGAPRQVYLAGATQTVRPVEANSIRMEPPKTAPKDGSDEEGEPLFNPVVIHDPLGWNSPTYENFVGEPRPKTLALEMADSSEAAAILAQVALLTMGQRGVDRQLEVSLAPWDMVAVGLVDVGYVVRVQGMAPTDRLITHIGVRLLQSGPTSQLRTTLTVTRLPALAVEAEIGISPYPGRINPL